MKLSSLKPIFGPKRKRVGRGHGTGFGKTSGRGEKGQKARSGSHAGPRPGFEGGQIPIYMRFPKRGFSNAPFRVSYGEVNVGQIDKKFDNGQEVTPELLRKKGLTKANLPVKILGNGDITKQLTIKAHKFSKSARAKIEAAGGSCLELKHGES
ncbi:MAG: 50S ribosomal protein L15 [Nitrospiraceae bacterium]|nr:50S ribosomal protein L15 [Nitrospiraceae bacterium]